MSSETNKNQTLPPVVVLGCGYLGREFARWAQERGHRVSALTRNAEIAAELRASGFQAVVAELSSTEWHDQLQAEGAWVVNTVSAGGGGVAGYEKSYVRGMKSILDWVQKTGRPRALAYTSSTSVYPQDGDVEVDENSPAEPLSENGRLLRRAEILLSDAVPALLPRVAILRLAGIYGPARHHLLDQLRAGTGEVAGHPDQWLNLIHRDDAVAALFAVLQGETLAPVSFYNVADAAPARREVVMAWLAQKLGVALPRFSGQPASGRRQNTPNRRILATRLGRETGWHPRFADFRSGYEAILGA